MAFQGLEAVYIVQLVAIGGVPGFILGLVLCAYGYARCKRSGRGDRSCECTRDSPLPLHDDPDAPEPEAVACCAIDQVEQRGAKAAVHAVLAGVVAAGLIVVCLLAAPIQVALSNSVIGPRSDYFVLTELVDTAEARISALSVQAPAYARAVSEGIVALEESLTEVPAAFAPVAASEHATLQGLVATAANYSDAHVDVGGTRYNCTFCARLPAVAAAVSDEWDTHVDADVASYARAANASLAHVARDTNVTLAAGQLRNVSHAVQTAYVAARGELAVRLEQAGDIVPNIVSFSTGMLAISIGAGAAVLLGLALRSLTLLRCGSRLAYLCALLIALWSVLYVPFSLLVHEACRAYTQWDAELDSSPAFASLETTTSPVLYTFKHCARGNALPTALSLSEGFAFPARVDTASFPPAGHGLTDGTLQQLAALARNASALSVATAFAPLSFDPVDVAYADVVAAMNATADDLAAALAPVVSMRSTLRAGETNVSAARGAVDALAARVADLTAELDCAGLGPRYSHVVAAACPGMASGEKGSRHPILTVSIYFAVVVGVCLLLAVLAERAGPLWEDGRHPWHSAEVREAAVLHWAEGEALYADFVAESASAAQPASAAAGDEACLRLGGRCHEWWRACCRLDCALLLGALNGANFLLSIVYLVPLRGGGPTTARMVMFVAALGLNGVHLNLVLSRYMEHALRLRGRDRAAAGGVTLEKMMGKWLYVDAADLLRRAEADDRFEQARYLQARRVSLAQRPSRMSALTEEALRAILADLPQRRGVGAGVGEGGSDDESESGCGGEGEGGREGDAARAAGPGGVAGPGGMAVGQGDDRGDRMGERDGEGKDAVGDLAPPLSLYNPAPGAAVLGRAAVPQPGRGSISIAAASVAATSTKAQSQVSRAAAPVPEYVGDDDEDEDEDKDEGAAEAGTEGSGVAAGEAPAESHSRGARPHWQRRREAAQCCCGSDPGDSGLRRRVEALLPYTTLLLILAEQIQTLALILTPLRDLAEEGSAGRSVDAALSALTFWSVVPYDAWFALMGGLFLVLLAATVLALAVPILLGYVWGLGFLTLWTRALAIAFHDVYAREQRPGTCARCFRRPAEGCLRGLMSVLALVGRRANVRYDRPGRCGALFSVIPDAWGLMWVPFLRMFWSGLHCNEFEAACWPRRAGLTDYRVVASGFALMIVVAVALFAFAWVGVLMNVSYLQGVNQDGVRGCSPSHFLPHSTTFLDPYFVILSRGLAFALVLLATDSIGDVRLRAVVIAAVCLARLALFYPAMCGRYSGKGRGAARPESGAVSSQAASAGVDAGSGKAPASSAKTAAAMGASSAAPTSSPSSPASSPPLHAWPCNVGWFSDLALRLAQLNALLALVLVLVVALGWGRYDLFVGAVLAPLLAVGYVAGHARWRGTERVLVSEVLAVRAAVFAESDAREAAEGRLAGSFRVSSSQHKRAAAEAVPSADGVTVFAELWGIVTHGAPKRPPRTEAEDSAPFMSMAAPSSPSSPAGSLAAGPSSPSPASAVSLLGARGGSAVSAAAARGNDGVGDGGDVGAAGVALGEVELVVLGQAKGEG